MGKLYRESLESKLLQEQSPAPESGKRATSKHPSELISDPKIIVQHAVPRVIADLIRGQYQLLIDGLKLVIEGLTNQSISNDRLHQSMKDVLDLYGRLIETAEKNKIQREESGS